MNYASWNIPLLYHEEKDQCAVPSRFLHKQVRKGSPLGDVSIDVTAFASIRHYLIRRNAS